MRGIIILILALPHSRKKAIDCDDIILSCQKYIMNKETTTESKERFRVYFQDRLHTMDVDLEYAIEKQAKRIGGEVFYTCQDCAEHKRGFHLCKWLLMLSLQAPSERS